MAGKEDLPMPCKETCAMDRRMRFVLEAEADDCVMSELCDQYGVSRTTGYNWLERYRSEGIGGLKDRSRAPLQHGRARPNELVERVLALRERYPRWGAKKLRVKLAQFCPSEELPAASTIGEWLCKEGLTQARRRRRRAPPYAQPFAAAAAGH